MEAHASIPSILEVEERGSEVQGYPHLYSELKATLGYKGAVSKINIYGHYSLHFL